MYSVRWIISLHLLDGDWTVSSMYPGFLGGKLNVAGKGNRGVDQGGGDEVDMSPPLSDVGGHSIVVSPPLFEVEFGWPSKNFSNVSPHLQNEIGAHEQETRSGDSPHQ